MNEQNRGIFLDDCGMLLFEHFQDACEAYQCSLDHLKDEVSNPATIRQGKTDINHLKRQDIWPRHDQFVDAALRFLEHYYLIARHTDIDLRHSMSAHLWIDARAHSEIHRVRTALAQGTTTRDEWSILHQLLDALQKCWRVDIAAASQT
jgi:hypothetical protein